MADVTEFIGKDYPIMGFGAEKSLSASQAPKERLESEQAELEQIRDALFAKLNPLIESVAPIGEAMAPSEPGDTIISGVHKAAGYGVRSSCWQVITMRIPSGASEEEAEFYFYGPPNQVAFSNDGPEPKFSVVASAEGEAWLLAPDIEFSDLVESCFLVKHKFGEDALFGCCEAESNSYGTLFGGEVDGEINPTANKLYMFCEGWGSSADEQAIDTIMADLDIVLKHLYAYPSTQGTYGVVPRKQNYETGQTVMTANRDKFNQLDSFYRGQNVLETNFTSFTEFCTDTSIKYINKSDDPKLPDTEWSNGDDINNLDEYRLAIQNDVESQLPSGTEFLLDMTIDGVSAHRYTKVTESVYHDPSMATYCQLMLTPDILSTVSKKEIKSSTEFEDSANDLLIADDIASVSVEGGSTYSNILFINQVTIRLGGVSSTSLPASGSTTCITATHSSGLVNYYNVFAKSDGVDPFAGYTVLKVGEGLPITYKINTINTM